MARSRPLEGEFRYRHRHRDPLQRHRRAGPRQQRHLPLLLRDGPRWLLPPVVGHPFGTGPDAPPAHLRHRRGTHHLPDAGLLRRAARPAACAWAGSAARPSASSTASRSRPRPWARPVSSPTAPRCRCSTTSSGAGPCARRPTWSPTSTRTKDGSSRRPVGLGARYSSKRRKTATAFWPPKPKPLTMAVSTLASRATLGT